MSVDGTQLAVPGEYRAFSSRKQLNEEDGETEVRRGPWLDAGSCPRRGVLCSLSYCSHQRVVLCVPPFLFFFQIISSSDSATEISKKKKIKTYYHKRLLPPSLPLKPTPSEVPLQWVQEIEKKDALARVTT